MASPPETRGASHEPAPPRSKKIRDHRDLRVWRKSRKLCELCDGEVSGFPEARFTLAGVIRRLANEVPEEIAAGQGQGLHAAYMDHLERARGALRHLERKLIEACKAGCLASVSGDLLLARAAEIERMLRKLMVSLEVSHAGRRSSSALR
jgi:four helix bundle protein